MYWQNTTFFYLHTLGCHLFTPNANLFQGAFSKSESVAFYDPHRQGGSMYSFWLPRMYVVFTTQKAIEL
jgi:hypothetical protein